MFPKSFSDFTFYQKKKDILIYISEKKRYFNL